jgi:type I restriction enzyme, S subunit
VTHRLSQVRVGVLPVETWRPAPNGKATFRYVDIGSVDRDTKSIANVTEVPAVAAPSRARQLLKGDDVLVSTVRPNLNAVAIVPPELEGAIASTGFTVLRPNPERLVPRFLFYWVQSPSFIGAMTRRATGATYPAVSDRIVLDSTMPMPSVAEQCRVADILDKADAIRRKRREVVALTEDLLRSAFLETFGDPVSNPKSWQQFTVGDITSAIKDGPHVSPEYSETGIPFISTRNIRPGKLVLEDLKFLSNEAYLETTRLFRPQRGDVLLTKGGTTGFAKMVDWDWPFAVWVHVAILRPTAAVLPEYLEAALNAPGCYAQSQQYTRGIANHDLGLSRIARIRMAVPPVAEQERWRETRTRILDVALRGETARAESDGLFLSLCDQAFGGDHPTC